VLLILIPLVWLAVVALVVAACQTASRGDGDDLAYASPASDQDRAEEAPRLVLLAGGTVRGEPPRPPKQVRRRVRAPVSTALPS
jgi:predicted small secreted protein